METNRQCWSNQQQYFQRLLLHSDRHTESINAFLDQHAMLHTASLAPALSAKIDIAALRAYWRAVGQRTRKIVQQVKADELRQRVEPERIKRVKAEGELVPAAYGVADYWGGIRRAIYF